MIVDCCHQLLTHLLHSFKIGFIIFWSNYSGGYSVQVLEMRPQTESFHEWQERWTVKRVFRWMSLLDCECLQADFASCACQSCNGHKECTRSPSTVKLYKIAFINLIIVWQCTKMQAAWNKTNTHYSYIMVVIIFSTYWLRIILIDAVIANFVVPVSFCLFYISAEVLAGPLLCP